MRSGWLLLAVVGLLGLSGCSIWGMEGGPGGLGASTPASSSMPARAAVTGPDGVQRVQITVDDDLRLDPSVVSAHPGLVEFTFHNAGSTPHDIEFPLPSAAAPVPGDTGNLNAGAQATVRLRVDQPGTYPFPCVYHQSSGMIGTLIVR